MDINTCDKYNFDELTLDKPKKVEDVYLSTVNGATIQTPKLNINKVSKKLTITINESMESLLNEFDNKMISLISENSEEFFEDQLSLEDSEEIYKHSFKQSKKESKISLSLNKNLTIYNKHKEQLELETLCPDDTIICLIKCKKLVFYKNYCEPLWEVFQIKLKEPTIDTKKYLFLEDQKDVYVDNDNDDDFVDIKKIKIKTGKVSKKSDKETDKETEKGTEKETEKETGKETEKETENEE